MPKQEPITRTFGLEKAQRCPQCGKLAKKVLTTTGDMRKRQEMCPKCQTEIEKELTINTMPEVFRQFAKAVNILIKQGIHKPNNLFILDSLKAVKNFYDVMSKDKKVKQTFKQFDMQNRIKRCAAQYAYFAICEYKRRAKDIQLLCPIVAKEIRQKGLASIQGEQYPKRPLVKACWITLRQEYGHKNQMSRYELTNRLRHIRNIITEVLNKRLKNEDQEVVQALDGSRAIENIQISELERKTQQSSEKWAANFVKQLSRLLTQRIKRNKNNMRPTWGRGFFDELVEEILGKKVPLDAQGRNILDLDQWQASRRAWRDKLLEKIQKKDPKEEKEEELAKGTKQKERQSLGPTALVKVKEQLTQTYIIKQIVKPRLARFRYTEDLVSDFKRYQVHQLVEELKNTFLAQNKPIFTKLVLQACKTVAQDPHSWLKIPHYEAQAIPLGIDDNRVYKLGQERDPAIDPKKEIQDERPQEIFVRLTPRPNQPADYRINDPKRWLELVDQGYTPQKPVLHKRPGGGALVLAVPFKYPKRPAKSKEETISKGDRISTSVDLGLKVLAALSITQGVQPITWAKGTTFKDLEAQ
ncbi:MAG: hypothetical protein ACFFBD_19980, partial [Candidatus Hodarchaeota archaeon]